MSPLMRSNLRSSSRQVAASTAGAGLAVNKQASAMAATDATERTRQDRDALAIGLVSRRNQEYAFTRIASCPADRSAPHAAAGCEFYSISFCPIVRARRV